MASSRNDEWETNYETYSEEQVEAIINECGIEIESETGTHFLCYCPFHNNTDSPAFAVDKELGKYICFNPSCYSSGDLIELPQKLLKLNMFQSMRLIHKFKTGYTKSLKERRIQRERDSELPEFKESVIDKMHLDFKGSPAEQYMWDRGFSDDTLEHFKIGYSQAKNLVAVPMYSLEYKPVGVVGRTIPPAEKRFRNSDNLPKRKIPWNMQNARKHGDTLIIVEASFDAMRIHQAGYPNVVALLGGYLTPWHHDIIDRNAEKLVVMTDFDKPRYEVNCKPCKAKGNRICAGHNAGRDFGRNIVKQFPNKTVRWAAYDDTCVYPHGAKDASDMTDEEIRQCLKNAVSNFEYNRWNIEKTLAS